MMITSDKFENSLNSFRSRFISPVYFLEAGLSTFCVNFQYNIYGDSNDGFRLIIENYLNPNENSNLLVVIGPLNIDKWYQGLAQVSDLKYLQFRVILLESPVKILNFKQIYSML